MTSTQAHRAIRRPSTGLVNTGAQGKPILPWSGCSRWIRHRTCLIPVASLSDEDFSASWRSGASVVCGRSVRNAANHLPGLGFRTRFSVNAMCAIDHKGELYFTAYTGAVDLFIPR